MKYYDEGQSHKDERSKVIMRYVVVTSEDDTDVTNFQSSNRSNNNTNKKIEAYTFNDPVVALSEFKPNFYDLL